MPSSIISFTLDGVSPVSTLPLLSSTPVVLVRRISFSACSAIAILPATTSALML